MDRRDFLALLSSAMAITASGCRRPEQKIVSQPYPVEYIKQSEANFYSSVYQLNNAAYGIQIKTREGKPIKIDGNDLHPVNGTSSNAKIQAELYSLYDPKRFYKPKVNANQSTLSEALDASISMINGAITNNLNILFFYEEHCSPSFQKLIDSIEMSIPNFKFFCLSTFKPFRKKSYCNNMIFGLDAEFIPQLSKAKYILSIQNDFLGTDDFSIFYANEFSKIKDCKSGNISKLITVESNLSLTGMNSDTRIVLQPDQFEDFLGSILRKLIEKKHISDLNEIIPLLKKFKSINEGLEDDIVKEMISNNQKFCVLVDENLSLKIHIIAMMINYLCGCIGDENIFDPNYIAPFSSSNSNLLQELRSILNNTQVGYLIFADCNSSITLMNDILQFFNDFDKKKTIALSFYETTQSNNFAIQIPTTHFLEAWSDAVSFNNCFSIQQPVISPLNPNSISIQDYLLKLAKSIIPNNFSQFNSYYDFIKYNWSDKLSDINRWEEILRTGVYLNNNKSNNQINFNQQRVYNILNKDREKLENRVNAYVLHLSASLNISNWKDSFNPLLKELPDPITSLSWDNAALINPKTAQKLNLVSNDIILIKFNRFDYKVPIIIQEGIADNEISYFVDFNEINPDKSFSVVNNNSSIFNIMNILNEESLLNNNLYYNVEVTKTNDVSKLTLTRDAKRNNRLDLSKVITENEYHNAIKNNNINKKLNKKIDEKGQYEYLSHFWCMAIDTTKCIGCGACVVACQIENNIPAIGKNEVQKNRTMHWIRIEKYSNCDQKSVFIPIMCQHCEKAPCEPVCPVNATTHSPEGINEMSYNRCIGSRFCMANCPYQVRRFNFDNYHKEELQPLENIHNPDVTLRMRGIVEKCTFCIQRINQAKYQASDLGRNRLNDGEVKTACQMACPTGAITFGDLNNPLSLVAQQKQFQHSYTLLEELNTKPSVFYLAKIRDKNKF